MEYVTDYFVALDLGKDRDYSALATMAYDLEPEGPYDAARRFQPTRPVMKLTSLIRTPLGTEYLEVIRTFRSVITKLLATYPFGCRPPRVYVTVDAGGPGAIAVELIRKQRLDIQLTPIVLTAGLVCTQLRNGKLTVPRRDLVATTRFLLEHETLRIADGLKYGPTLERELEVLSADGGQSAHDDLAIATGLAAWHATRIFPILRRRRIDV